MEHTLSDGDSTENQHGAISQLLAIQDNHLVGRSSAQPTSSYPGDNRFLHGTTFRLLDSTARGQVDPLP